MKKGMALVLAAVMMLLAACGNNQGKVTQESSHSKVTESQIM